MYFIDKSCVFTSSAKRRRRSSSLLILLYFKLEFVVVAQWFTINRVIVRFCSVVSDILCSNFIKSYDEFCFVSVVLCQDIKTDGSLSLD